MTQTPENQQQYGSILTILGENAEQNGKLQNKQITFTHMAIGDANDEYVQPDRKQTALVNELARIPVNSVDVLQPTPDSVPMLKVEAILPDDVNDLVIREFAAVATFDGNTYFHAVGNNARIYVPPPVNNGNVSTPVTLEMIFVITSADPIVEMDPNVVTASREWTDQNFVKSINTAMKMKSMSIPKGIVIKTHGYYSPNWIGAASYKIWDLEEYRTEIGNPAWVPDEFGDHTLQNGNIAVLQSNGLSIPEQYGCLGDNTPGDAQPLQAAFNANPSCRARDGARYNLNGEEVILPMNFTLLCNHSTRFLNGSLNGKHHQGENIEIGDIRLQDCDLTIGGTLGESNHATGYVLGKTKSIDGRVNLLYHTGLVASAIHVHFTDDEGVGKGSCMALACLYESSIEKIHVSGFFEMGFQTMGNGSEDVYNTYNTTIGKLVCKRDISAVSVPGHHGFYLLGNYGLTVGSISAHGYGVGLQGVSNCLKVRDCWDCKFGPIVAESVQLASDANTGTPLRSLKDNVFERIDLMYDPLNRDQFGKMTITVGNSGIITNNKIKWFRGELATSGSITTDGEFGFEFSDYCRLTQESVQADKVIFANCEVHWDGNTTGQFTRKFVARHCEVKGNVSVYNNHIDMEHTCVHGDIVMDSSTGTRTIELKHVTGYGILRTNSYGSRVVDANMVCCAFSGPKPVPDSAPDGNLFYRMVSFSDGYYLTEDEFIPKAA